MDENLPGCVAADQLGHFEFRSLKKTQWQGIEAPPTEMPSQQIPQDKLSLDSRWIVQKRWLNWHAEDIRTRD